MKSFQTVLAALLIPTVYDAKKDSVQEGTTQGRTRMNVMIICTKNVRL